MNSRLKIYVQGFPVSPVMPYTNLFKRTRKKKIKKRTNNSSRTTPMFWQPCHIECISSRPLPLSVAQKEYTNSLHPYSGLYHPAPHLQRDPSSRPLLDRILTVWIFTPGNKHDILGIQCRNDIFPICEFDDMLIEFFLRSSKHVVLNCFEERGNIGCQRRK